MSAKKTDKEEIEEIDRIHKAIEDLNNQEPWIFSGEGKVYPGGSGYVAISKKSEYILFEVETLRNKAHLLLLQKIDRARPDELYDILIAVTNWAWQYARDVLNRPDEKI